MGQQLIQNDKTGEKAYWDGSKYVPLPQGVGKVIRNDQTGEVRAWDGTKYAPIEAPHVPEPDALTNAWNIARTGVNETLASLAAIPRAFVGNIRKVPEGLPPGAVIPESAPQAFPETTAALPTSEEALKTLSDVSNTPVTHGQEASGRILESTMQGATAGALTGPAGLVGGALSSAASQSAAELGAGPMVQAIAGLGLPLLFGGISTTVRGIMPSAEKQLGQALAGVTKPELFAAETAMRQAQAQGNPLTWSEALNSVTNGKYPELAQLQRAVEQTSGGGKVFAQVMSKRLDAAKAQAGTALDKISPSLSGQAATDVPENMNVAAQSAIRRELKNMRTITKPAYTAAAGDLVPESEMARIVAKLDQEIASTGSQAVKSQLQAFRNELVETPAKSAAGSPMAPMTGVPGQAAQPETFKLDIGRLDSIRKTWRDKLEVPNPAVSPEAVPQEVGAKLGPILSDLRDTMKNSSAAYKVARDYHSATMQNVIEPLRRAQTGQLAQAPATLQAQRKVMLPQGEQGTVTPEGVADTVKRMETARPGSAAPWLRQNLQSQFDDILKTMQTSGSDASRGASLWAKVVGNETQKANLKAYVTALPGGDQTWQGFQTMLDTLEAQRYRLPANSATAFNAETLKALQAKGIPFDFTDLNPTSLFSGAMKEASAARRLRLNSQKLANTLLDVGARQRLAQLAKLQPNSREARRLVGAVLGLTAQDQHQQ